MVSDQSGSSHVEAGSGSRHSGACGRGAPEVWPDGPKQGCPMGATEDRGRFSQEACLLILVSGASQGYSPFRHAPNGFRSRRCRINGCGRD